MNVHIINTHLNYPNWSEGGLNNAMVETAKSYFVEQGHDVTETRIEDGYDTEVEAQRHLDSELVLLQTPINWFGAPWIYKKYVDEVFNVGLHAKTFLDNDGRTRSDPTRQYGTGGHMEGKKFMIASTWNAPLEAFDNPDGVLFEGKGEDDLLLNITSNYKFVGYTVLKNFGIYDIFRDEDIAGKIDSYKKHLEDTFTQ